MKRKLPFAVAAAILFLGLTCRLPANEMQRLVFNAAGNLGVVIVIIDNQGITPQNTETIRAQLNLAATQLNQVATMYQDPPFEVDAITALPPKLERFFQATDGMNSARRMYYLSGVYSNLKSAMTLAYNSRRGTYYCATCDTFVVDLGHFLGQAYSASRLNDAQMLSMTRSRVNLAISEGIKASGALGCGFPSWAQWQELGIQNARNSADWERIVKGAERLVASAQGLTSAVTIPSSTQRQGSHNLLEHLKINCGYMVYGFKQSFYAIFRSNGTMELFRTQGSQRIGSEIGQWSYSNQTKILSFGGTSYGSFSGTMQPSPQNPNTVFIVGSGSNVGGDSGRISFSVTPRVLPD